VSARKPRTAPRRTRKHKPRGERTESTIYAGSRLMGELVGRIGDFTARDAKGKRLGKFKTFETARSAIYTADDKAQAEARAQLKANAPRPAPATANKPAPRRAGRVLELVG
jgi:hypothetical protein